MTDVIAADCTVTATLVAEDNRLDFLPHYLGRQMLLGEQLVYRWLSELTDDYSGGYWHFYELSNGGFYMAPEQSGTLRFVCADNYFEGDLSADAAGIVATLYALNQLVCKTLDEDIYEMYYRLRDFAGEHDESAAILGAID